MKLPLTIILCVAACISGVTYARADEVSQCVTETVPIAERIAACSQIIQNKDFSESEKERARNALATLLQSNARFLATYAHRLLSFKKPNLGDWSPQLKALESELDENPESSEQKQKYIALSFQVYNQAIRTYSSAIDLQPTDKALLSHLYSARGWTRHLISAGFTEHSEEFLNISRLALNDLDKSIEIYPDSVQNYLRRSRYHVYYENHERALSDIDIALSVFDRDKTVPKSLEADLRALRRALRAKSGKND